ncbi:MAG: ABC transporter substrate-binding protein [Christensenellales bacterium]|jgi:multiple sugar transport system substrate-binding protein
MKKFLSLFLALVMMAALVPAAMAEETITIIWHTTKEVYENNLATNPDTTFDAVWSVVPAFEEKYGVKVDVRAVAWGDMLSTAVSMVNNGESVDLVQANDQSFPVYPARNMLLPISDYVDVNDPVFTASATNAFTFGGKPYAVGAVATPVVLYYNVDLFENNGIDLPRDLYEAGEWDWEAFRKAAMALTFDSDNNGENDVFGFGFWDTDYVHFLASNGTSNLIYNADGTISTGYLTEAGIETMTFLQNAYTVDKYMYVSASGDDFVAGFKNGKLGMTLEYGFAYMSNALNGDFDFEVDWVPMPRGPKMDVNTGMCALTGWGIGITSANPTAAANFIKMSCEMEAEFANKNNTALYGAEAVAEMNELAARSVFVPIGIDKYWDNNHTVFTGLRSNEPVVNFLTIAEEQVKSGFESTMSN